MASFYLPASLKSMSSYHKYKYVILAFRLLTIFFYQCYSSTHRFIPLAGRGAQAAILGCTEIGLLSQQKDTVMPLYDTTLLHATQAALSSI